MDARETEIREKAIVIANQIADDFGLEHPTPDTAVAMMMAYRKERHDQMVAGEQEIRLQVAGTGFNVNFGEMKHIRWDVYVALGWSFLKGSTPDVIFAAALHVLTKIQHLPDAEADVVNELLRTPPRRPYSSPVSEAEFRKTYLDGTVSIDALLASLEKKEIIVRSDGGILLTR